MCDLLMSWAFCDKMDGENTTPEARIGNTRDSFQRSASKLKPSCGEDCKKRFVNQGNNESREQSMNP